jgi:hypothetical protein
MQQAPLAPALRAAATAAVVGARARAGVGSVGVLFLAAPPAPPPNHCCRHGNDDNNDDEDNDIDTAT